MEKQALSDREKFNTTTLFLTKFLFQENFDSLKKVGLINSFIEDPTIMELLNESETKYVFLLFNNKKLKTSEIKIIVESLLSVKTPVAFEYELVNNFGMVVIKFPSKFIKDYNHLVQGQYSKLSLEFKESFPNTKDVFNEKKQRIGKEYTIYHHIFNKTDWLKEFWMKKLNLVELDDSLELWEKPTQKDLEFDISRILK